MRPGLLKVFFFYTHIPVNNQINRVGFSDIDKIDIPNDLCQLRVEQRLGREDTDVRSLLVDHSIELFFEHRELPIHGRSLLSGSSGLPLSSDGQVVRVSGTNVNLFPLKEGYYSTNNSYTGQNSSEYCYSPCGLRNREVSGTLLSFALIAAGIVAGAAAANSYRTKNTVLGWVFCLTSCGFGALCLLASWQ